MITLGRLWEEHTQDEARPIIREEKREKLKIKLSPSKEDSSSDEEYEGLTLEETLIHISIQIINDE